MKPVIENVICPDIQEVDISKLFDLEAYTPELSDNFGFLLQMLIGPENEAGMESFQLVVCTPKWLSTKFSKDDVIFASGYLLVFEYDSSQLINKIRSQVATCTGKSWVEIAEKLARFSLWEFEDYVP